MGAASEPTSGGDAVTEVIGEEGVVAHQSRRQRRADLSLADDTVILHAEDMQVDASWGHIYGPVNFSVRAGGVTVLSCMGGRGRTSLLLTLAGRMRPTKGTLTSMGQVNDSHHLFRNAAIAKVDEVDGVGQAIRVSDIVTEQVRWAAPWYSWVSPAKEDALERICRPVFGDYTLPTMDAMVEELPEFTAALFRIAVANIRKPPLLVVGGVDELSSIENASKLLDVLVRLGKEQTVVTTDVNIIDEKHGVREVIVVRNVNDHEMATLEQGAHTP